MAKTNSTAEKLKDQETKKDFKVNQSGMEKFVDALNQVHHDYRFFYHIIKGINIRIDHNIPTMAVAMFPGDKTPTLLYNSDFVMGFDYKDEASGNKDHYNLTKKDVSAVIIHEALHLCLQHLQRWIPTHNRRISNVAQDLLVNSHIPLLFHKGDNGKTLGDFSIRKDLFPFMAQVNLDDVTYPEVYDMLMKNLPKQKINKEKLEEMIANGQLMPDDHPWEDGDLLELDEEAKATLDNLFTKAAKQCEAENNWGHLPGELMRHIQALMKPKNSWRTALEYFIQSCRLDTTVKTWKKLSRRYGNRASGRKSDNAPNLLIGVDTSGSIDQKTFDLFTSYMDYALAYCRQVRIVFCDTQIGSNKIYEAGTKEHLKGVKGGGGTMLQPIFDVAKDEQVDGVILLTDGYCDHLNTHGIPTVALLCPGGVKPPGINISAHLED